MTDLGRKEDAMIKGVNSVVIWTEDVKKLAPFYRDTLGLKTSEMGDEFAVFEIGGTQQLGLGVHSEVKGRSKEPNRVMINLDVDDCRAEYERLKAKGVQFVREPSSEPMDGTIIATLQDPDGNTLQLFQSP
jgi:predicted enzyme related to lactoylglutathione lyase